MILATNGCDIIDIHQLLNGLQLALIFVGAAQASFPKSRYLVESIGL
jgi:hypothetical protein